MPSSLSWLDFSEAERRKMIEIVSLFKERDTRDELGVASIRDSFADLLFPGTSTLQTRARYFLFVPWLYRHYETLRLPSAKIAARLKQDEIALIGGLIQTGETASVIGQRSGASLHRFPSSIYWIGLQRWGICQFPGTQYQYQFWLDYWQERQRLRQEVDERAVGEGIRANWDPDLPPKAEGFPYQANFALIKDEARYLKDRLQIACADSLLAYLVENTQPVDDPNAPFPWLHPSFESFPSRLQSWLTHARNFSEALHGAALLYNLMLAERIQSEDLVSQYQSQVAAWAEKLRARQAAWYTWNRGDFWALAAQSGANIPAGSHMFVDKWLDLLFERGQVAYPENEMNLRAMVENRERRLKGVRSRFSSQSHLGRWSGASFAGQIDYRWRVARRISNDILDGLRAGDINHAPP